ncbi:MAG TPA: hypothetical protein VEP90_08020, partial [Methylomirabilota bacterium]|nr:hypothetical protein [Methylomirabilota bacterium]
SNWIAFNDMSGPWSVGLNIINADGNIVYGNTVGQIAGSCINIGASATNTLIQGNICSGAYGQFATGIQDGTSNAAAGCKFKDNFINGTGWHGIILQSNHSSATGNLVQGNNQITSGYGIVATVGTSKFIISDNVIVPASTGSIHVETGSSDYYNIIGNMVEGVAVVDGGTGTHKTLTGNN